MDSIRFSKDFVCSHREFLPCRFCHKDGDIHRCSFDRLWVLAKWLNQDEEMVNYLLDQACSPIKEEEKFKESLIDLNRRHVEDIIENAQIGDLIFCFIETAGNGVVTLLEKPENDMEHCIYRNQRGEIKSCQVGHCCTLAKGDYFEEHHLKGNNSKIESMMIERIALESGFRVEIQKTDSGHLVKIFGNTQREVDDFMTMCVYNKFLIY